MIYYPVCTLVNAGINEVLILTGGNHAEDFINVLRNCQYFGLKEVKYAYQEPTKSGIADGDSITVILGDNTTDISNVYLEQGNLEWSELQDFWSDAGTFESLFDSNAYWAGKKRNQE